MRNKTSFLLAGLIFMFVLVSVRAADLKTLTETYHSDINQIQLNYTPKFEGLRENYQKDLVALRIKVQGHGDLKKTLAAKAELERWQKTKTMPVQGGDVAIPEIKELQARYVEQSSKTQQELTQELGRLSSKHMQDLTALQKKLTMDNKLDDALAMQPELDKAQAEVKNYAEQLAALKNPLAPRQKESTATDLPQSVAPINATTPQATETQNKTDFPAKPDLAKLKFGKPINLLDKGLNGWTVVEDNAGNKWSVHNGVLSNRLGGKRARNMRYTDLRTDTRIFVDFNLKTEVNVPKNGNSGIFLRGVYEIQICDSYGKPPNWQNMGALYKRLVPAVAAEKPADT